MAILTSPTTLLDPVGILFEPTRQLSASTQRHRFTAPIQHSMAYYPEAAILLTTPEGKKYLLPLGSFHAHPRLHPVKEAAADPTVPCGNDRLGALPPEVLTNIFSRLPAKDLARIRRVNTNYRDFITAHTKTLLEARIHYHQQRVSDTFDLLRNNVDDPFDVALWKVISHYGSIEDYAAREDVRKRFADAYATGRYSFEDDIDEEALDELASELNLLLTDLCVFLGDDERVEHSLQVRPVGYVQHQLDALAVELDDPNLYGLEQRVREMNNNPAPNAGELPTYCFASASFCTEHHSELKYEPSSSFSFYKYADIHDRCYRYTNFNDDCAKITNWLGVPRVLMGGDYASFAYTVGSDSMIEMLRKQIEKQESERCQLAKAAVLEEIGMW